MGGGAKPESKRADASDGYECRCWEFKLMTNEGLLTDWRRRLQKTSKRLYEEGQYEGEGRSKKLLCCRAARASDGQMLLNMRFDGHRCY